MRDCILACPGVSPAASVTGPAHATTSASSPGATQTVNEALITLGSGDVVTAVETTATVSGSAITEAILGSLTITLGGAEATVSSEAVSLLSNGVEVGGTTTVAFNGAAQTLATSASQGGTASATSPNAAATSSGAANRHGVVLAGVAGVAGVAAMLFQ